MGLISNKEIPLSVADIKAILFDVISPLQLCHSRYIAHRVGPRGYFKERILNRKTILLEKTNVFGFLTLVCLATSGLHLANILQMSKLCCIPLPR